MNFITDIQGIKVGHASDEEILTGCSVVLTGESGAVAGVDVRGGAPGSRENILLAPEKKVDKVHAILLSGGSAFGLEAAGGVMRYLRKKNIGYRTGVIPVPIVPASVIFDLDVGEPDFPTSELGLEACEKATAKKGKTGNVGAGYGATVGKIRGRNFAMQGGLTGDSLRLKNGVKIGVMVVVNCFGEVIDEKGEILAGVYNREEKYFIPTINTMEEIDADKNLGKDFKNTTLVVIATDAHLNKSSAKKLAQMGQNGIARAIRPAHSMFDGDTVYALSTGDKNADLNLLGAKSADLVAQTIRSAINEAEMLAGIPASSDIISR